MRKISVLPILQQQNPFGLLVNDEIMLYSDAATAYYNVLVIIMSEFPRGMIDLVLLMQHQGLSVYEAQKYLGRKQYMYIEFWKANDPLRDSQLRMLFHKMLKVTGCGFDAASYWTGVQTFDKVLRDSDYEERLNNGKLLITFKKWQQEELETTTL